MIWVSFFLLEVKNECGIVELIIFLLLMHLFMIEFDMVGDSVGSCTNAGALFAGL